MHIDEVLSKLSTQEVLRIRALLREIIRLREQSQPPPEENPPES